MFHATSITRSDVAAVCERLLSQIVALQLVDLVGFSIVVFELEVQRVEGGSFPE
jgi:hypothetical protein